MNSQKIAIIFLALVLTANLTACGGSESGGNNIDTNPVSGDTNSTKTTDDGLAHDDLGDIRFDGETFNMWLPYSEIPGYVMEENTGDIFDDAIYARNMAVEERLGVDIVYTFSGHPYTGVGYGLGFADIRNYVMSGDDSFDVFEHVQNGLAGGCIDDGLFVDWNDVPNVDLTKEYWYKNAIDNINYGSKLYRVVGYYENSILSATNCIFFNKRIFDENKVEYPYAQVLAGTWTIDSLMEIITKTTADLDGDTKLDRTVDQFGYLGRSYNTPPALFIALGGDCIVRNENNMPQDVIMTERNSDIIDRLLALHNPVEGTEIIGDTAEMRQLFIDAHTATVHGELGYANDYFREMKDNFGFVPYPKMDVKQENYNSYIRGSAPLTYIPVTNTGKNLEMTGAVLEIMACESFNRVVPAYVDVVLTTKVTRDTESEQMIPIILDSASFYDHVLVDFDVVNCYFNNTTLTVEYAKHENYVKSVIEALTKTYT
ncbi:MAG: extracellular solute-binding protein [Clostridia bacterium]|nr:extracellular solute-binding protein [Clostridia bacterium]